MKKQNADVREDCDGPLDPGMAAFAVALGKLIGGELYRRANADKDAEPAEEDRNLCGP